MAPQNWERVFAGAAVLLALGGSVFAAPGAVATGYFFAATIVGLPALLMLFPGRISRRLSSGLALALLALAGVHALSPENILVLRLPPHVVYVGFFLALAVALRVRRTSWRYETAQLAGLAAFAITLLDIMFPAILGGSGEALVAGARIPLPVALAALVTALALMIYGLPGTRVRPDRKISVLTAGALLTTAVAASVVAFGLLSHQTEQVLENSLAVAADSRVRDFSRLIAHTRERAELVAGRPHFRKLMQQASIAGLSATDRAYLERILDDIIKNAGVSALVVYDNAGQAQGARGFVAGGAEFEVPLVDTVTQQFKLLWQQRPALFADIELRNEGEVVGRVFMNLKLSGLRAMLTDRAGLGDSGTVAICALASPGRLQCLPIYPDTETRGVPTTYAGQPLPMTHAVAGRTGVIQARDYRGVAVTAAFQPIVGTPMGVVAKIDRDEFYAPVARQFDRAVLPVILLVMLGTVFVRRQVVPIANALVAEIGERRRIEADLRTRETRLTRQSQELFDIAVTRATANGDRAIILQRLMEAAARTLGAARASMWVYDPSHTRLECIDLYEQNSQRHSRGVTVNIGEYPAYFAALAGNRPIAAADACRDPRTREFSAGYLRPLGIGALLDVPIRRGDKLIGVVCHEHIGDVRTWTTDEQNFATSIAHLVSLEFEATERERAEDIVAGEAQILEMIARGVELSEVLLAIIHSVELRIPTLRASVLLYDPSKKTMLFGAAATLPPVYSAAVNGAAVGPDASPCGIAMYARARVIVPDLLAEEQWQPYWPLANQLGVRASWSLPIINSGNEVLGTLSLLSVNTGVPTTANYEILDRAVRLAEIAIDRMQAQARIAYLAHHDSLTGIANRATFNLRLTEALIGAAPRQRSVGVAFIDVDRFKNINDSLGHETGDALLRAVAERLAECIRRGDTLARLGGDEFSLVLADMGHPEDAAVVAQKIVASFAQPFQVAGQELFVTASVGVALYPNDGADADTLLKNADIAMYRAKEGGRNTFQFFTAEMNQKISRRLAIEHHLRKALVRNELSLHYQPQVNLHNGRVMGVEALLRWDHPDLGSVSPAEFIPVAEETGLIMPIGEWVLRTACVQQRAWEVEGVRGLKMSVNLSARQFQQKNLAEVVMGVLAATDLSPESLTLELTESALMQNAEYAVAALNSLHAQGIGLSVDDFGTGYASLSYLKRFPIDVLKIDRSFVNDITTDPDDAAIAQAIITMAHSLGISVLAEGVETTEQLAFLTHHDCDAMQGYYFSRPVPAAACGLLLKQARRLSPRDRGLASVRNL